MASLQSSTVNGDLTVTGSITEGGYTAYPERVYTINFNAQSSSNFYPIVLDNSPGPDPTWHHTFSVEMPNQGGGVAYNMHSIYGEVRGQGWSDASLFYRIFQNFYDNAERSILGIWRGTQSWYGVVVYVRGGQTYYVRTNSRTVAGYTSAVTLNSNATFAIKNASNTDVSGTSANISQILNLINNPSGFYHSDVVYGSNFSGSGSSLTNLTAGNLSGTIPSAVLGNSSLYVGTTQIALNRSSASQTLTGISIDGNAATATASTATNDTLPTSWSIGISEEANVKPFLFGTLGDALAFRTISNLQYWTGSAWQSYTNTGIQALLTGNIQTSNIVVAPTNRKFRFEFTAADAYIGGGILVVHQAWNIGAHQISSMLEYWNGSSWVTIITEKTSGGGENDYHFYNRGNIHGNWTQYRVTITSADTVNSTSYTGLQLLYDYSRASLPNNFLPFTWDYARNVTLGAGLTASGPIKGDSGANYPHSFTNTDAGNTHWANRYDRLLTSNGTNWATDGRDPIMAFVTSGNSNATTIANSIGLTLHNESQTDNTFSPAITFSNRSNSGSYNTAYATIIGKKTGQGVDGNWSAGELHFYTMPAGAYINNIPSLMIDSAGEVGIGTTAPVTLLQIGTGTPTSATSGIQFGSDTGARIYRGGSNAIQISNVLQVGGYIYGSSYLQLAGNYIYPQTYTSTLRLAAGNSGATGWIDGLTVAQNGNVTIAGTLTMSAIITTVSSGTAINFSGQSDSFGYNATAGLGTYIKGTGGTYIYGGGSFFDGSAQRALLHAGNYSGYSSFSGSVTSGYGSFASPGFIIGDAQYGLYVSGGSLYYKSASGGVHYWRNIANNDNTMYVDNSGNLVTSRSLTTSSIVRLGGAYTGNNSWINSYFGGNIYWDGSAWQNYGFSGNNGWGSLAITGTNGDFYWISDAGTGTSNRSYTEAQFLAKMKMILTGGGNLGIGTTAPATTLQIGTATPTAATSGIQFGDDTGARIYRSGSSLVQVSNNFNSGGWVYAATYLQTGGNLIYPSSQSATQTLQVGNAANNAWIAGLELSPGGNVRIPGGIVNAGLSAQWSISGGGTVTFSSGSVLWSQRVIAIPVENTEFSANGYIDINCPTSGTVTYYNSSNVTTTVTCTANGIPLGAWEALYYEVTPGQSNTSDQTKFRVVAYPNTTWRPSSNWLLLATRNSDVEIVRWIPGQANIFSGGSYDFSRTTEYFYANNYYFRGATTTYIRSDNEFNFLYSSNGNAQNARFNGIQVSSSYSGTLINNGILFSTDTNLYRSAADTLKTDDSLIINTKCAVATSISATYTVDINGTLHYTSASQSSDVRFKKNVEPINDALIKLNNVRGVKFEWNEFVNARRSGYELNKPTLGVIAQEIEAVFPELVDHWRLSDDCTDARAVNYERIVPVLIEAVKELNNKNIQLEARLSALESKLQ